MSYCISNIQQVDWCGDHDTVDGHKEISAAMNATGRPMVLELCRGTYQSLPDWGYAPVRVGSIHFHAVLLRHPVAL